MLIQLNMYDNNTKKRTILQKGNKEDLRNRQNKKTTILIIFINKK